MSIVVNDTWSSSRPVDCNELIKKVARRYGGQNDDEMKNIAKDCIDETIKDLNKDLYEFNIIRQSNITITADQSYVNIISGFFKPKNANLIRTSDNYEEYPLSYIDWASYKRMYSEDSSYTSRPVVYTSKNLHGEGRLYLGPTPDSSTANNYTLRVDYYKRIPLCSEVDSLDIFQEAENAILNGALRRFAEHITGPDSNDTRYYATLYLNDQDELKAIDRRQPDEMTRFRIVDHYRQKGYRRSKVPFYIRID